VSLTPTIGYCMALWYCYFCAIKTYYMKKIFSFTIILIISLNTVAQNVGIGTDTPTEKLDVHGNLNLTGKILLNGSSGFNGEVLISKGVGTPPVWGPADLALPYAGQATIAGVGFRVTQTGTGGAGSFIISNPANANTALFVNSEGTGFAAQVFSTNAVPKALRTIGAVQFSGIGESQGGTLTCDEDGFATWQAPVAFMVYLTANTSILQGSIGAALSAVTEEFDEGNDVSNGVFIVPRDGIYHFNASVKWGTNTVANFVQATIKKCDQSGSNCITLASSKMNNQLAAQQAFGVDCKLEAGAKIKVFVSQTNADNDSRILEGVDANNNISTFFSGHLVK